MRARGAVPSGALAAAHTHGEGSGCKNPRKILRKHLYVCRDSVPCFLLLARRDGGVGVRVSSVGVPRSASSAGMLPTLLDDRKKNALVLQRGALLRGALLCALCLAVVVGGILAAGWEIQLLRASTAQAQRSALVAAHHSSVQLVSRTLSLQSELDMQEDHDRAVLQLYLQLEREALPHLLQQLTTATAGCSDEARQRVSDATTSLRREMHAHSTQMLDKLQKALSTPCARCPAAPTDPWSLLVQVAARARARANELAADVAKQARADRQRLRAQAAAGEAAWSDEELEAPLTALLRALQRPNATFALAPEVSHEPRGGGRAGAATLCAQTATLRGHTAALRGHSAALRGYAATRCYPR